MSYLAVGRFGQFKGGRGAPRRNWRQGAAVTPEMQKNLDRAREAALRQGRDPDDVGVGGREAVTKRRAEWDAAKGNVRDENGMLIVPEEGAAGPEGSGSNTTKYLMIGGALLVGLVLYKKMKK